MNMRRQSDLAILEIVSVTIAVMAIGIFFIPRTLGESGKMDVAQATQDVQKIAFSLQEFYRQNTHFPSAAESDLWKSAGEMPASAAWLEGKSALLSSALQKEFSSDPWGHCYLVNADAFEKKTDEKPWVLSAGPNGRIDTSTNDKNPSGDDIGIIVY